MAFKSFNVEKVMYTYVCHLAQKKYKIWHSLREVATETEILCLTAVNSTNSNMPMYTDRAERQGNCVSWDGRHCICVRLDSKKGAMS